MRKKILWLSRHKPLVSQIKELKRIFGNDMILLIDNRAFSSAEEIKQRMQEFKVDDIVVVAPLSVIQRLTQLGIKPIWAEMKLCSKEEAETQAGRRYYKFVRFRRIKDIKIIFEDV